MARRIRYTGAPVLTLEDVARQCRVEVEDLQPELIEGVIIPGVTAQGEARSGAAIREAEYEEDWPEHYPSGHALDIGQASEVLSVARVGRDGSEVLLDAPRYLQRGQRESFLHFPDGRPAGVLRIRYKAGCDLAAYPGVRSWLLMHAATAYQFRETMVTGHVLHELPAGFLDALLADIALPPRF
jgi:hypothetical protein